MTAPTAVEKAWGKARIEALSDGVFAITMTLLVLEIRIPELPRHAPVGETLHALATLGPMLFSFSITFMLAGAFWYMHHLSFHNTKYVTRPVCAINVLFLMFVSLLPFSTGLLGRLGLDHPIALAVYFGNQLVLGVVLNLHWEYARRHGLLVSPISDPAGRFMIAVQPLGCLLALATIRFAPPLTYYAFVAVVGGSRVYTRRRFQPLPPNAPAPL